MNKKVLAASVASLAALSLAACGSGDSASSGATGDVTLQMVDSQTSPARTTLLKELLAACEAEVPGVKVELISPPFEQADQKIQQMLQAGSGIDILEVRDTTVGSFSTNGWLYDMTADFKDWDGREDLTEATLKAIDEDENLYVIPYSFSGLSLFYRTDLVDEAGFSGPPESWADLLDQASTIQDPSSNTFGYAFRGGKNGNHNAVQAISTYVVDDIDTDNAYFLKDGSTIFSAPEAKEGLDLYLELFEKASPPSSIAWGFPEMVEGFSNGSTAFLLQDPEVITALQDSGALGEEQWSTTPVLKGPSGKAFQARAYAGWGVAESSQNKEQAVEVIKCLSSGDRPIEFAKQNNQIPILKSAAESEYYKTGPWESYMTMNAEPEVYVTGTQPRDVEWWQEWVDVSDSDLQTLLMGKTTTEEVLQKWDAYWVEKTSNSN